VEVLPASPAAVRTAVDIEKMLELLRDLDHRCCLQYLDAVVAFTIPHGTMFKLVGHSGVCPGVKTKALGSCSRSTEHASYARLARGERLLCGDDPTVER
jgi:hypothetical protein